MIIAAAVVAIAIQAALISSGLVVFGQQQQQPLRTHWINGTLVFDNATSAKIYLIQKDIQREEQAVRNACLFHNETAIVICPSSPSQLSTPLNVTTKSNGGEVR